MSCDGSLLVYAQQTPMAANDVVAIWFDACDGSCYLKSMVSQPESGVEVLADMDRKLKRSMVRNSPAAV